MSFNSLRSAVQKFFWWAFWGPPPGVLQNFGQNNCLTNNFLYCEFQLFMFSSLKVLFFEGVSLPGGLPNLVKVNDSQTSSYIVSLNFLCSAV